MSSTLDTISNAVHFLGNNSFVTFIAGMGSMPVFRWIRKFFAMFGALASIALFLKEFPRVARVLWISTVVTLCATMLIVSGCASQSAITPNDEGIVDSGPYKELCSTENTAAMVAFRQFTLKSGTFYGIQRLDKESHPEAYDLYISKRDKYEACLAKPGEVGINFNPLRGSIPLGRNK